MPKASGHPRHFQAKGNRPREPRISTCFRRRRPLQATGQMSQRRSIAPTPRPPWKTRPAAPTKVPAGDLPAAPGRRREAIVLRFPTAVSTLPFLQERVELRKEQSAEHKQLREYPVGSRGTRSTKITRYFRTARKIPRRFRAAGRVRLSIPSPSGNLAGEAPAAFAGSKWKDPSPGAAPASVRPEAGGPARLWLALAARARFVMQ